MISLFRDFFYRLCCFYETQKVLFITKKIKNIYDLEKKIGKASICFHPYFHDPAQFSLEEKEELTELIINNNLIGKTIHGIVCDDKRIVRVYNWYLKYIIFSVTEWNDGSAHIYHLEAIKSHSEIMEIGEKPPQSDTSCKIDKDK